MGLNYDGSPSSSAPEGRDVDVAALKVLLLGLSATTERSIVALLGERLPALDQADLDAVQPAELSRSRYDLIVLEDLGAESGHAESLWAWLAKQGLSFLILSGTPDERRAARAQRAGACGYLGLPTSWKDLEAVLEGVAHGERNSTSPGPQPTPEPAVWEDPAMVDLGDRARRVAVTNSTVLLRGEMGVGKSRLAHLIHAQSNRSARPWIEVDADANSEEALDLALFGAQPSMARFAERAVPGALEQAQGGTLYIREIARLPSSLQVRLLRALERGELRRSGDPSPTPLDVRVLASSSEDLAAAVAEGRLREDLYYELSTVELLVPPLRERPQDIEALAKHVLREQNQRYGTRTRWSAEALEHLKGLPWEGNVRELRRFVQRCFVWSDGPAELSLDLVHKQADRLRLSSVAPPLPAGTAEDRVVVSVGESIPMAERKLIEATLERFGGDKRLAAKTLGISLKTLYTRLQRYRVSEAG
jgi:DNA-binding NtrC family response regulator